MSENALAPIAPTPLPPDESFRITAQTRLLHADLLAAARKVGSVTALAEYLGLSFGTVSAWINLRLMPALRDRRRRSFWQKKWPEVERKLFELTGKRAEELFPGFVRISGILESERHFEETREVSAGDLRRLKDAAVAVLPPPEQLLCLEDVRERILGALATLPYREREVLKLRFGIGGGYPYSLEEVARIFKITRERVRQIECNAMRKLKTGAHVGILSKLQNEMVGLSPCPSCSRPGSAFERCLVCNNIVCAGCRLKPHRGRDGKGNCAGPAP